MGMDFAANWTTGWIDGWVASPFQQLQGMTPRQMTPRDWWVSGECGQRGPAKVFFRRHEEAVLPRILKLEFGQFWRDRFVEFGNAEGTMGMRGWGPAALRDSYTLSISFTQNLSKLCFTQFRSRQLLGKKKAANSNSQFCWKKLGITARRPFCRCVKLPMCLQTSKSLAPERGLNQCVEKHS